MPLYNPPSSGSGAPTDATYVVQTANATLSAEQALSSLTTGVVKVTNATGVLSTAAEGTDYYKPAGTDVALADGGTGASLVDPNADRIVFWDDSAGAMTWLTAGTGLTITDTTIAASSDSIVFNLMAANLATWADGAVMYYGSIAGNTPTTTADIYRVYVPIACTITRAYLTMHAATPGTNEAITFALRKNNTTDTAVGNVANTNAFRLVSNAAMSVAMAAGDYFEIKVTGPTWATNPANVRFAGTVYATVP